MSRKARLRAAAVAAAVLALGLLLATNAAHGTWSFFDGRVQNSSSVLAGGWIPAPTSLTVSPSGYSGSLAWTPGSTPPTPTPITGQQLEGYDAMSTNSCTQSSEAAVGSALGAGTTTLTDSTLATSSTNGHYMCYWMRETSATVWYTEAAFSPSPVQVGFVPTAVAFTASGTHAGQTDPGDKITITFNQAVAAITSPTDVCVNATPNTIFLGDSNNCKNASDGYTIGELTGFTIGGGKQDAKNSTVSVVGDVVTITLAGGGSSGNVVGAGTFTAAASGINSSTGSATACTSSVFHCTPTSTGSF